MLCSLIGDLRSSPNDEDDDAHWEIPNYSGSGLRIPPHGSVRKYGSFSADGAADTRGGPVQMLRLVGFVMSSYATWQRRPLLIGAAPLFTALRWSYGLVVEWLRRR